MPVLEAPGTDIGDPPKPLAVHLSDLRSCLLQAAAGWCLATVLAYAAFPSLLGALLRPPVDRLVFLSPIEPFIAQVKMSMTLGLALSLPWVLFQAWRFVAPGLRHRERRVLLQLIPASYALFLLGAALGLFVAAPLGLRFLLGYASPVLVPAITLGSYLGYLTVLVLGLGALFQVPILIFTLAALGLVTPATLSRYRRHVVLGILLACAAITPSPDIAGQVLLAVPAYLLYEATVLAVRLRRRPNVIMGRNRTDAET